MKSFDELYLLYYKDVFRFLFKLCGYNQDIAEELTQETFFHAYLGITKFRTECNVKTWIFQIAKNRYFMYLRKESNIEKIPFDELIKDLIDCTVMETADALFEKKLISDALDIIFSFPQNMQTVFLNRIYTDMSYSEIAQSLSISESSAKVLFHRAKLLLRKKLKGEYGYEI